MLGWGGVICFSCPSGNIPYCSKCFTWNMTPFQFISPQITLDTVFDQSEETTEAVRQPCAVCSLAVCRGAVCRGGPLLPASRTPAAWPAWASKGVHAVQPQILFCPRISDHVPQLAPSLPGSLVHWSRSSTPSLAPEDEGPADPLPASSSAAPPLLPGPFPSHPAPPPSQPISSPLPLPDPSPTTCLSPSHPLPTVFCKLQASPLVSQPPYQVTSVGVLLQSRPSTTLCSLCSPLLPFPLGNTGFHHPLGPGWGSTQAQGAQPREDLWGGGVSSRRPPRCAVHRPSCGCSGPDLASSLLSPPLSPQVLRDAGSCVVPPAHSCAGALASDETRCLLSTRVGGSGLALGWRDALQGGHGSGGRSWDVDVGGPGDPEMCNRA